MDELTVLTTAIDDFRFEKFTDHCDEEHTVQDCRDPDVAMGCCDIVAEMFADFMTDRGIDAEVVGTEDATRWGFQGTTRYGTPTDHGGIHFATRVGDAFIDWTASQFIGCKKHFPLIKRWDGMESDYTLAECSS